MITSMQYKLNCLFKCARNFIIRIYAQMWKQKQMQKLLITAALTLVLSGCSGFPGVYKIDIPQGNVVNQEMVDKLRPGMTESQVRFIMGSPLITDTFHEGRWDYLYSKKSGSEGDGSYVRERISLYFTDGKLNALNGDFRPGGNRGS